VTARIPTLCVALALGIPALAQSTALNIPGPIDAGSSFSIRCGGSGKGTLYIVGPGQLIKRDVDL